MTAQTIVDKFVALGGSELIVIETNCPKQLEWENIDNYHKRAKVFGGWLVKAYEDVCEMGKGMQSGYNWRMSMTFVPDQFYQWEIE